LYSLVADEIKEKKL